MQARGLGAPPSAARLKSWGAQHGFKAFSSGPPCPPRRPRPYGDTWQALLPASRRPGPGADPPDDLVPRGAEASRVPERGLEVPLCLSILSWAAVRSGSGPGPVSEGAAEERWRSPALGAHVASSPGDCSGLLLQPS